MAEYLKLIGLVFLVYLCTYSIVNRICKCVEHHSEWKYRARVDIEWVDSQLGKKLKQRSKNKEENRDV